MKRSSAKEVSYSMTGRLNWSTLNQNKDRSVLELSGSQVVGLRFGEKAFSTCTPTHLKSMLNVAR